MAAPTQEEMDDLKENLNKAQQAVDHAKAALTGVSPSLIQTFEDAARRKVSIEADGTVRIGEDKRNKLADLAANSKIIISTSGDKNNCLLNALNASSAAGTAPLNLDLAETRKGLYGLYNTIFADNFPGNIVDAAGYNNNFSFTPLKSLDEIKDALLMLRKQVVITYADQVIGQPGNDISKNILDNLTKPADRMLHAADLTLLSVLCRRPIVVIKNGGAEETFDHQKLAGGVFAAAPYNAGGPVHVQDNGGLHFQGINANGVIKYNAIKQEEANAKIALDQDVVIAEQAVDGARTAIANVNLLDTTFQMAVIAYGDATQKLLGVERDLATALKRGASVTPPKVAVAAKPAPASAPLATEQLLYIQKKRDALDESFRAIPVAKAVVPPDFLTELDKRHRDRDTAIKNHELLKRGESVPAVVGGAAAIIGKNEAFRRVLFNLPISTPPVINHLNVFSVKGDKNTSLFLSLRKPEITDVPAFQGKITTAQTGLTLIAFKKALDVFASTAQQDNEKKLFEEKNRVAKELLDKHEPELKLLEEKCKDLGEQLASLEEEEKDYIAGRNANLILKDDEYENSFSVNLGKLKWEIKRTSEKAQQLQVKVNQAKFNFNFSENAISGLNNKISEAASDKVVIEAAFLKFYNRMQVYAKQQADGAGDVLNPLDVQWAAILRKQTITIVKPDGTTHSFLPDVFADEDLKSVHNGELKKYCKNNLLKELGIDIEKAAQTTRYIYDNGSLYQRIANPGSCNAAQKNAPLEIKKAEDAVTVADKAIADHLAALPAGVSLELKKQAAEYSSLLGTVSDALREGKSLAAAIPSATTPVQHAWETKLANIAMVSITAAEESQRDLHRQNIDTLLTLFLQGTPDDRAEFVDQFTNASAADIINLKANIGIYKYGEPFDTAPMFYAKGMTVTPLKLEGSDADENVLNLIKKEINAYLELKKISPDSALAQDYKAILVALDRKLLVKNDAAAGLKAIPDSVMKPVLEGIHERVAAKAPYVASMIDASAYEGKIGKNAKEQEAIRSGIHNYRQAVNKQPQTNFDPATAPTPKTAHSLKQTSYTGTGVPTKQRIVFDVKGMTLDQVMNAFNDSGDDKAMDKLLSVKNDKDVDCRIVAVKEGGRLKLYLQESGADKLDPLTKSVWNKGAGAAVEKALKEIASVDADLKSSAYDKPRMR